MNFWPQRCYSISQLSGYPWRYHKTPHITTLPCLSLPQPFLHPLCGGSQFKAARRRSYFLPKPKIGARLLDALVIKTGCWPYSLLSLFVYSVTIVQIGGIFLLTVMLMQRGGNRKGTAHNSLSRRRVLLAGLSVKRIILVLILAGCRRTAVSPVNGTVQGLSIIL